MRVLIVLVALVATPFLAGVSQARPDPRALKGNTGGRAAAALVGDVGLGHDDAHCAMRADLHPDKDINKCEGDPTPPPPPAGAEIHGTVFHDVSGDGIRDPLTEPGIGSWFVMLAGTTIPAVQTDVNGDYAFTGLSAGSYTVCAQQRSFNIQTAPQGTQCSGVGGYTIVLTVGQVVTGQDFGFFF